MKSREIIQNSAINLLNIFVSLISGIASSILLARYLDPRGFGYYQTTLWLTAVGTTVLGFGMGPTVRRFVADFDGGEKYYIAFKMTFLILRLQVVVAFIGITVLVINLELFLNLIRIDLPFTYALLSILLLLPSLISGILLNVIAGFQKFTTLTLIGIIQSAVNFLSVLLTVIFSLSIEYLLVFLLGNSTLIVIVALINVRSLKRSYIVSELRDKIDTKPLVKYAALVFITLLLDIIVWQRSEIFFLSVFSSTTEVGFYALAYSIAGIAIGSVPGALSGVLMPALTKQWSASDKDSMRNLYLVSLRYIALVSFPICVIGTFLSEPVILFLYGTAYGPTANLLPLLLLSSTMAIMAGPASSALHAIRRPEILAKLGLFLALINILLAYYFIPEYGAFGAAISNLCSQTIGSFIVLYITKGVLSINYNIKIFLLIILAALTSGIIARLLLSTWIMSILVYLLVFIATYIFLIGIFNVIAFDDRKLMLKYFSQKINKSTRMLETMRVRFFRR